MARKENHAGQNQDISTRAVSLFIDSDFNCAESVLLASAECLRRCTPSIPCLASAFGGGMGREGSVCGALTGALMALGLVSGRSKPTDDKEKIYGMARQLYEGFTKRFGSPFCSELIECDLGTREGRDKYHKLNLRELKCKSYVFFCSDALSRMLGSAAPKS